MCLIGLDHSFDSSRPLLEEEQEENVNMIDEHCRAHVIRPSVLQSPHKCHVENIFFIRVQVP